MKPVEDVENNADGFQPEYYIILEKIGKHYKIIGYKSKILFTHSEIPFDLKQMIMDKCLEQKENSFRYITDFQVVENIPQVIHKKESIYSNIPLYDKEIVFSFRPTWTKFSISSILNLIFSFSIGSSFTFTLL